MTNMISILKKLEVFRQATERDLREFAPYIQLVHLRHRQTLFEKGQPIEYIYLIIYGTFKVQETIDHHTVHVFNFLSRGEFLGITMAGLPHPRYPTSAVCSDDSTLLKIPVGFFFDILFQLPDLRRCVNRQISERFLEFQNDICKSHKLASQRIADLLLRLLERQEAAEQEQILIPLTRSDIAERISSQSETVIRILSQWTKNGWIRTVDRHISILNRQALEKVQNETHSPKATRRTPTNFENV